MLGYYLLIMISILFNPVQAIEIKTDFNSFYEDEKTPYRDLLKIFTRDHLPAQRNLPKWRSRGSLRVTSVPSKPSIWLKEKLGITKLGNFAKAQNCIASEFFQEESKDYLERKFLIRDPIVGKFEVSILSPTRLSEKSPILLALHGHGGSADDFKDVDFVRELISKGTIVVIPNFRAMENLQEVKISQQLFSYGFSLMGVRIYECFKILNLVKKLFPSQRKIGLIGHSGGSAIASLLAWIVPNIAACAIDYTSTFRRSWKTFCCEGIPELHNNGSWIFDPQEFPVPLRKFPYNFVPETEAVYKFFMSTLTPPENIKIRSKTEVLPVKMQNNLDQLIREPSIFSSELTSQVLGYVSTMKSPVKKDNFVFKSFKYAFLLPVEEQPTFLFERLNTPNFKFKFFSHLSVLSGLESSGLRTIENHIIKLISNYPSGSQRNVVIANTIYDLAKSNPKVALRLLSKISSLVSKMSASGRKLLAEASLITLHADPNPVNSLSFWPVDIEEKILLGAEWASQVMDEDLKNRLLERISKLFSLLNKDTKILIPYPVLKNLVNTQSRDLYEPQVSPAYVGEEYLSAMLRVGKILIMRNKTEDAASLAQWFWDPEKGAFYLSELADNVDDEETIKLLVMTLKNSLPSIEEPIFRVPFVRTLLRYFGDRGQNNNFERWFAQGLKFCLDSNWNFDRFEPKYTMMLSTAAEYGYSKLVIEGLAKLPNVSFLDHVLSALLDKSLEVGNTKIAELITSRHKAFKSRNKFLNRITLSKSKYESTGNELGQTFSDYAFNKNDSEEFDLDSLRRALDEYRGRAIQDVFGEYLKKVLDSHEDKVTTRQYIKVIIDALKAARLIKSDALINQAQAILNKAFQEEVPEDWQNFILDWIEVLLQNGDLLKAKKLAEKLSEEEIRVKYLVKSSELKTISKTRFNNLLKSIQAIDNNEDRANIFLDFAESQIHNHQYLKIIISELEQLDQNLPSEMRLEIPASLGSMMIENGYGRKGYEIINTIQAKKFTLEKDLQFECLSTMFALARDLSNSALCFQILRKLLQPLQSKKIPVQELRLISELMIDFKEDQFPLEKYLINSVQKLVVEKLRSENSACSQIFTREEALKDFTSLQVIEKCLRFLED